ncbi:MAG TPA: glycosyltransferase [Pyrinomonadaceae bacterium]
MPQPSISVVITSYNYAHFLGETIRSVLSQTRPAGEVIVVDDGSADDSVAVARSFGDRVRVVEQPNQGVCVARNNGARLATGDVIAFLDSDDIWLPHKLERQAEAFRADPEVGLVSCGIRFFNPRGETIVEYNEGKSGWCANDILLYKEPVLNTTASAVAVRRDVFEAAGGFDPRRELFAAEDREFAYRAARLAKIAFIPEILVDYRIHGANGHLNIRQMDRALFFAYEKIFSGADEETLRLRRESYGNLHRMLAGCYFRRRDFAPFVKHAARSLWLTPSSVKRFAAFPVRVVRRVAEGRRAGAARGGRGED